MNIQRRKDCQLLETKTHLEMQWGQLLRRYHRHPQRRDHRTDSAVLVAAAAVAAPDAVDQSDLRDDCHLCSAGEVRRTPTSASDDETPIR